MRLGTLDLVVLAAYLASTVVIGLYVSRRTRGLEAYLLGDRDLAWWAILGSIVATETSTVTVLSVPGKAYGPDGLRFLQLAIGYFVGRCVIVWLLLPLYFQGRLLTAYQVLDRRFGAATKRAASLLFLVCRNLGDGLRLFLAALVLQKLSGWELAPSVGLMGLVTIVYTFFGGMRSVVFNDCVQLVVYLLGAVAAALVIAGQLPGGITELLDFARTHDKWRLFDFRLRLDAPYTFWAGLLGGAVLTLGTHGTDHMMVQRYLSARSQADAGKALIASGAVVLAQFALFLFLGVELAAYYARQPEVTAQWAELARQQRWTTDDVFAHFIVHHFLQGTGLVGLMLAAILAAAMSTLSSSLNASAAALVHDFYLPWRKTQPAAGRLLWQTRWLTVAFGGVQMGIALLARQLDKAVVDSALTIAGFSAAALLGVFLLGLSSRKADQTAAIGGGLCGLAALGWLHFIAPQMRLPGLPEGLRVAWPWYALLGASVTWLAGLAIAAIRRAGPPRREAPPDPFPTLPGGSQ
jgi:SSS family solute:Na+ symporter